MEVLNVHQRVLAASIAQVLEVFHTLGSRHDRFWPTEYWPAMRLNDGLRVGSAGGHGPIRYRVTGYDPGGCVEFEFLKPAGFSGTHRFELRSLAGDRSEITHTLAMETSGYRPTLAWLLGIRWLHDALLEDALDKVENQVSGLTKKPRWNPWVKILQGLVRSKSVRPAGGPAKSPAREQDEFYG